MADGFEVIVKINLPPEKQYHSGHSVIVQGHTAEHVATQLDELVGIPDTGKVILATFGEFALQKGVETVLSKASGPVGEAVEAGGNPATAPTEPASTEEAASAALLKAISKKHGIALEDLQSRGLAKSAAQELLKKGESK